LFKQIGNLFEKILKKQMSLLELRKLVTQCDNTNRRLYLKHVSAL